MSREPEGGSNRRTVLKTLGSTALGAGVVPTAAAGTGGSPVAGSRAGGVGGAPRVGVRPTTIERPIQDARCWFVNAADRPVDVFVNYHAEKYFTVKPEEDQEVFSVDSDASRIYGTYTFEARQKDDPDGEVLASVSITFEQGEDYTAAFHRVGEAEYRFSVYENGFAPSQESRFVIRHNSFHETLDWELFPAPQADPSIPEDERSGTLGRGQWQEATDVTENEYRLEIYADGDLVAFRQDLELEAERVITCYVVGHPQWWMGSDRKEGHVRRQEFQVQVGGPGQDATTAPAAPYTTTDENQSIEFECSSFSLYETNVTETEITATDPDGIVADLAIDRVEPYSDGVVIPDETVDRALAVGGTTDATLRVKPKVPPGNYEVDVEANPESLGEQAACTLPFEVKPVTVDRLRDLVDGYEASGEMDAWIANDLRAHLDDAEAHLAAGETDGACEALKAVITIVGENKAEGITVSATVDVETETKAFRKRLGCG